MAKNIAAPVRRNDKADLETWQMRMDRAGKSIIEAMCTDEKYKINVAEKSTENGCDDFNVASQTKSTMKGRLITDEDGITIHADICGPLDIPTIGGKNYFATFTISRSKYTDIALLSSRDQVGDHLEEIVDWAERQSGVSVKRVHWDNAKEFKALVS